MKKYKRGRPSKFTPRLVKEICETIAFSDVGLQVLCRKNKHWPSKGVLMSWLKKYPEFLARYQRAKDTQIDRMNDELYEATYRCDQDFVVLPNGSLKQNTKFTRELESKFKQIKRLYFKEHEPKRVLSQKTRYKESVNHVTEIPTIKDKKPLYSGKNLPQALSVTPPAVRQQLKHSRKIGQPYLEFNQFSVPYTRAREYWPPKCDHQF